MKKWVSSSSQSMTILLPETRRLSLIAPEGWMNSLSLDLGRFHN